MERSNFCNIPVSIDKKISKDLYKQIDHPIYIICKILKKYFSEKKYIVFEDLPKYVSTKNNFDDLLIPKNHCTRNKTDTYYLNESTVLRTHMTSHSAELLSEHDSFITIGDVYRKDEIDKCHYPIFHQLDGVQKVPIGTDPVQLLKSELSSLVEYLFPKCEYRFNSDYFPFTNPSYEVEVFYNGKWLEILGCGIFHKEITKNMDHDYIAFGLGIDRLAMIFFEIPDIRLFWSDSEKFLTQFKYLDKNITLYNKFIPFSNIDSISKDISFWLPSESVVTSSNDNSFIWTNINSFYELARDIFSDDIEAVELIDKFYYQKKNKYSHTFRLKFSPTAEISDPGKFTEMTNNKMKEFAKMVCEKLNVENR
jgi:phenylalanyl-tRNA synthetase alpha chain